VAVQKHPKGYATTTLCYYNNMPPKNYRINTVIPLRFNYPSHRLAPQLKPALLSTLKIFFQHVSLRCNILLITLLLKGRVAGKYR
jgi:hypothetical protein